MAAAVVAGVVAPVVVFGQAEVASAAPSAFTCSTGTVGAPQSLPAGTYSSVTVTGVCAVNAGQVIVTGNVSISGSNGALVAAFALNGGTPGTTSGITVQGSISVTSGGTLILGCFVSSFPCADSASLNSPATVQGSIDATGALGVVVHDTTIGADAVQTGGGGGSGSSFCATTPGIFALVGAPVYSDYEDNTISGNLRVTGVASCWFGVERNKIGGSATFANGNFNIPNASEILSNQIAGNLLCTSNVPAVQFGTSSSGTSNVVSGFATGQCAFGVLQPKAPSGTPTPISVPANTPPGYWMAAADGGVFSFGVKFLGSAASQNLTQPIVGMAAVPGGGSYDLAQSTGAVFGEPATNDCTGLSGTTLNKPVVGIASAPGGNGCWLAASDGGVFAFGSNAPFFGSAGALTLNKPVVGIGALPNNDGYDLVASDGGIFTYGPGAQFYGSMGGKPLNKPIVGIATDPSTGGYWEVASDGGVFAFNAPFFGSTGNITLNQPVVGIAAAPTGNGYYLVASDGGVFAFGNGAHFQGSTGNLKLVKPVVGIALG
jgi:hypothetical protein